MQYILMILCLFGAVAAMVGIKSLDAGGWTTAILVVSVILVVIYSLARIQSRDPDSPGKAAERE